MKYILIILAFLISPVLINSQLNADKPLHVIINNDLKESLFKNLYVVKIMIDYKNKYYKHLTTTIKYLEKDKINRPVSKNDVEFAYLDRDDLKLKIKEMRITVSWKKNNRYCEIHQTLKDPNPIDVFEFNLSDFTESPCSS